MTRINCVPVQELTDRHLLAEYRELPRVFKLARHDVAIPPTYRMGKGHVLFFYNKLAYLKRRQAELIKECQSRGFNVQFTVVDFVAPAELDGDWLPDDTALEINRKRINERLRG